MLTYDAKEVAGSAIDRGELDMRYRLYAVGPNVLDTVRSVGGWLFDHAMAGWDVTVAVLRQGDPRPLRILGAGIHNPGPELTSWANRSHPHVIAVAGDLLDRHARLKRGISSVLVRGQTPIVTWGQDGHLGLGFRVIAMQHELSVAARVFKSQALVAAGDPKAESIGDVETFGYSSAEHSPRRLRRRDHGLGA